MEAKRPVLFELGKMIELCNQQINSEIALTMALGGGYRADAGGAKPLTKSKETV